MSISRRDLLAATTFGPMAGAAAAAQAPAVTTKKPSEIRHVPFDPTDVAQSTKAFLKFTGSLGTETIRKWFTGKVYAYFPGEPVTPLFYLDGFYLSQYKALPDGTHHATRYEVTIKRDLETGALLETWNNPFTDRTDTVVNSVGGPQYKLYNAWGFDRPERARTEGNPLVLDWMVFGNDAWVTWDIYLRFKNPLQPSKFPLESSGEMLNLVNLTNYKGKLSDIENPDIQNAPGVMIWNAISEWQPWMRMGQTPGTLFYKAIGVKVETFRDIPPQIFDATEKAFPGHLSEQRPWKEGSYQWFDREGSESTSWEDSVDA